jgi:hypothetical protein
VGRWTRREGPLDGPLPALAAALHVISALERGVESIVDSHAATMPEVLRLARHLFGSGVDSLRAMTLDEALTATRVALAE